MSRTAITTAHNWQAPTRHLGRGAHCTGRGTELERPDRLTNRFPCCSSFASLANTLGANFARPWLEGLALVRSSADYTAQPDTQAPLHIDFTNWRRRVVCASSDKPVPRTLESSAMLTTSMTGASGQRGTILMHRASANRQRTRQAIASTRERQRPPVHRERISTSRR